MVTRKSTDVEIETQWHPVHGLDLSASANFMDTKITRYNSIPGTGDNTGNRLANSPETMLTGRVRYQFPLGELRLAGAGFDRCGLSRQGLLLTG